MVHSHTPALYLGNLLSSGCRGQVTSGCPVNIYNNLATFNPFKPGTFANSIDPDQRLHSVASDQGLHCLH